MSTINSYIDKQNAHSNSIQQIKKDIDCQGSNEIKNEGTGENFNLSDETEIDQSKKVLGLYSQQASTFLQNKEIQKYNHNLSYINLSWSLKNSQKKISNKVASNTNAKNQIFSDKSFTNGSSYNDEEQKLQQFMYMNKNLNVMNHFKEFNFGQDIRQQLAIKALQNQSQTLQNQDCLKNLEAEKIINEIQINKRQNGQKIEEVKSDEENVSDESYIESKNKQQHNQPQARDQLNQRINQNNKSQQPNTIDNVLIDKTYSAQTNIQVFDCVLNQRKNNQIYSFSQNVDYDRLTQQQKKRFLTKSSNNQSSAMLQQKGAVQPTVLLQKSQNLQMFNKIHDNKIQNNKFNTVDADSKGPLGLRSNIIQENQLSVKKLKLCSNKENLLVQKQLKKKNGLQTQRSGLQEDIINKKFEKEGKQSPLSQLQKVSIMFKTDKIIENQQTQSKSTLKRNTKTSQEKNQITIKKSENKKIINSKQIQNNLLKEQREVKNKNIVAAPIIIQYASLNSVNKESNLDQTQKKLNKNAKVYKRPESNQSKFQESVIAKSKGKNSQSKQDFQKKSCKDESASQSQSKSNKNILTQRLVENNQDYQKGKNQLIKKNENILKENKLSSMKSGSKQSIELLKNSKQQEQQSANKSLGNKHCKTPKLVTYKPTISINLIGQLQNDQKGIDNLRNLKQTNSQKQFKFKKQIHAYLSYQTKQIHENFDANLIEFNNMEMRQTQKQNCNKLEKSHFNKESNLNQLNEHSIKIKSQQSEKFDSQYMKYLSNSQDEFNLSNFNKEQEHLDNPQKLQNGSAKESYKHISLTKNIQIDIKQLENQKLQDSEKILQKTLKLQDESIEPQLQQTTNQTSTQQSNYNKFLNQTPETEINNNKISCKYFPLAEQKLDFLSISKKNDKIKVLSHQKKQNNILQQLKQEKIKIQSQVFKQKQVEQIIHLQSNEDEDFEIGQIPAESQSQAIGFTSSDEITQFNQNDCISCFESDLTHKIENQFNTANNLTTSSIGPNKLPQRSEKKFISQSSLSKSRNLELKINHSNEGQKSIEIDKKFQKNINETNKPINRKEILEIIESEENQETSFDNLNQNKSQIDLSQFENSKENSNNLEKKEQQQQEMPQHQIDLSEQQLKMQSDSKNQTDKKCEQHMLSCMCEECKNFDHLNSESSVQNSLHNSNQMKYKHIIEDASNLIDYKINFHSILEQKIILSQLKDLIEIRPSVIQQYSNIKSFCSNSSGGQIEQNRAIQAIEGLSHEERVKIQQLCQEWWDCTQEDKSIFYMALSYQQNVQQNYCKSSIHEQNFSEQEKNYLKNQTNERSQCMRNFVILQSVVIGMTAFFSMLVKRNCSNSQKLKTGKGSFSNSENTIRIDLELRQRMSQLIKIIFDQFMLCQSYLLGKLSSFDKVTVNSKSPDHKLYTSYCDHIHLLHINKKIQSENDYLIFNHKNTFPQYPKSSYIVNEENRDYQISQLSKRLKENIFKILDQEIEIQEQQENRGNIELLCILKDICIHSDEIDFQEGKNHIYQGISLSEVMPGNQSVQENNDYLNNSQIYGKINDALQSQNDQTNIQNEKIEQNNKDQVQLYYQSNYGTNLIKTFNNDANQIILEESREDSMSVSQINSSKMEQINQISHSINRSKINSRQLICSPGTAILDMQEYTNSLTFNSKQDLQGDFEKVLEIHESEESELDNTNSNLHFSKQL